MRVAPLFHRLLFGDDDVLALCRGNVVFVADVLMETYRSLQPDKRSLQFELGKLLYWYQHSRVYTLT